MVVKVALVAHSTAPTKAFNTGLEAATTPTQQKRCLYTKVTY